MRRLDEVEVLRRAAQGESVLRDNAYATYYAERMDEYIDLLLRTPPGVDTVLEVHRQMLAMQDMANRFANWYNSGQALLEGNKP